MNTFAFIAGSGAVVWAFREIVMQHRQWVHDQKMTVARESGHRAGRIMYFEDTARPIPPIKVDNWSPRHCRARRLIEEEHVEDQEFMLGAADGWDLACKFDMADTGLADEVEAWLHARDRYEHGEAA